MTVKIVGIITAVVPSAVILAAFMRGIDISWLTWLAWLVAMIVAYLISAVGEGKFSHGKPEK